MKIWGVITCLLPIALLLDVSRVSPPITALAFAPDGKSVVVGSQAGVAVRDWPSLTKVRALPTKLAHVHDLAFSPDGKSLLAVGGEPAKRGSLELHAWPTAKLLAQSSPSKDLLLAASWRPDSRAFSVAGADSVVRTFSATSLETHNALEGHSRGVLTLLYLPDGQHLVSAGLDESLRVWNADKGDLLRTLSNHARPVLGLALRPNSDGPPVVASIGEDRTLRLWQPTTGRMVRFARLKSVPQAVSWSKGGDALLVACKDGQLRVIDPDTMDVQRELPAVTGVAYSLAVAPDGSVLVGGQHGQLRRVALND